MRRVRCAALAVVLAVVLTACAIPHKKDDFSREKVAAGSSETQEIFTRYREVRNLAIELLDPKPLSTVESGPVLAIDTGSFEVSQRLAEKQKIDTSKLDVIEVKSPLLTKYPMWFMAKVRDAPRGVIKIQVFSRATAVDTWSLVASPEILLDTTLPGLRTGRDDTLVEAKPKSALGKQMSPQEAADTYAEALGDQSSAAAEEVENDGFIRQMREVAEANKSLDNVTFSQSWAAEDVEFAARTQDGGALVFATMLRLDSYEVKNGVTVTWPEGSPQRAFLSKDIATAGKLRYYHQVLLYLPGEGGGKPRALGQYGGVVGAEGI